MIIEFKFPDLGEGITEGEIIRWKVKVGDRVKEEETLAEVETDKALVEVPSPRDGYVIALPFKEGDIVKVGETLIVLGDEEDLKKEERPRKDVGAVVGVLEEAPEEPKKKVLATPAVRKLARDLSLDITRVEGTGHEGRITEEDIKRFTEERAKGIKRGKDTYGNIQRIALRGIRRTIAKNIARQQHITAHVTHMDEMDATELHLLKGKEEKALAEKGIRLTYLPFIIKATIAGLKEYPLLNSTMDEGKEELIIKEYYNIGIAVDTPDGLMVPVIKDADKNNIIHLAEEIQRLAEKARSRRIGLHELKGGTFSITNVGALSGTYATPIINYPEVAILGIGRIQDRPWVVGGEIKIRKIAPLSLTFDHRVMDGADVARFLKTVIKHLEDPGLILIELV
ncbi:MAG: 2-oxo acid dehydrogenase subunit E2 [Deltaproteobacteria bacterium]|nr:2-oxo acid dehydrogenase subunit E2 [Deltaproteobacteria bacterium]